MLVMIDLPLPFHRRIQYPHNSPRRGQVRLGSTIAPRRLIEHRVCGHKKWKRGLTYTPQQEGFPLSLCRTHAGIYVYGNYRNVGCPAGCIGPIA